MSVCGFSWFDLGTIQFALSQVIFFLEIVLWFILPPSVSFLIHAAYQLHFHAWPCMFPRTIDESLSSLDAWTNIVGRCARILDVQRGLQAKPEMRVTSWFPSCYCMITSVSLSETFSPELYLDTRIKTAWPKPVWPLLGYQSQLSSPLLLHYSPWSWILIARSHSRRLKN